MGIGNSARQSSTPADTFERREFTLCPELSDDERLCYEHEYGIAESGVLVVTQRRALLRFVVQELSERRCWRNDGSSVPVWSTGPPAQRRAR